MRIAITGHTAGIGQSFAKIFQSQGHHIVGISRRDGNNIRNIPKIVPLIEPCDIWINNAQAGFAQTELLLQVWSAWRNTNKMIWNISTVMTQQPRTKSLARMDIEQVIQYKNQKRALEDAHRELACVEGSPLMVLIRPGRVATDSDKIANVDSADVDAWASTVVDFYHRAREQNLWISDISLGFRPRDLDR